MGWVVFPGLSGVYMIKVLCGLFDFRMGKAFVEFEREKERVQVRDPFLWFFWFCFVFFLSGRINTTNQRRF